MPTKKNQLYLAKDEFTHGVLQSAAVVRWIRDQLKIQLHLGSVEARALDRDRGEAGARRQLGSSPEPRCRSAGRSDDRRGTGGLDDRADRPPAEGAGGEAAMMFARAVVADLWLAASPALFAASTARWPQPPRLARLPLAVGR